MSPGGASSRRTTRHPTVPLWLLSAQEAFSHFTKLETSMESPAGTSCKFWRDFMDK